MSNVPPVKKIRVESVFEVPAYHTVYSEEGAYEARGGYNVIAYSEVKDGCRLCLFYVGPVDRNDSDEYSAPHEFNAEADVVGFVGRVKDRGWINSEYWYAYESQPIDALPDYALNPHRPEYN
jgi:hypothetical protein